MAFWKFDGGWEGPIRLLLSSAFFVGRPVRTGVGLRACPNACGISPSSAAPQPSALTFRSDLFILDKSKPVVRRGRKAMGPGARSSGSPGCRRDEEDQAPAWCSTFPPRGEEARPAVAERLAC